MNARPAWAALAPLAAASAARPRRSSARHDAVSTGFDVLKVLRRFSDVERITRRLALKSVRPRELAGLRDSLKLLLSYAKRYRIPRPIEGTGGPPPDPG